MKYCCGNNYESGQANWCRNERLRESLALLGRVNQFRSPHSWIMMCRSLRKLRVFDLVPSYLNRPECTPQWPIIGLGESVLRVFSQYQPRKPKNKLGERRCLESHRHPTKHSGLPFLCKNPASSADGSAVHIWHTQAGAPGAPRRALLTADGFQTLTTMHESLENSVLITQREGSGRRPGQEGYIELFLSSENSVDLLWPGCPAPVDLGWIHVPLHTTSETITQKSSFLGQIFFDFDKQPPIESSWPQVFFIAKQEVHMGQQRLSYCDTKAGPLEKFFVIVGGTVQSLPKVKSLPHFFYMIQWVDCSTFS